MMETAKVARQMTWDAPILKALQLPSGAHFYRCALQVNPHHYNQTFRGEAPAMDEAGYVQAIIQECKRLDIRVIAITDHNHVGAVDHFREEGAKAGILVFPGFEISSAESVHVLCIYPLDTPVTKLERYLGAFGVRDLNPSSALSSKPFAEILADVPNQGGVVIAAHVTQENGLLFVLHGQARINAWQDPNLLAVQVPGAVDEAPDDKRPILRNQNAQYRREAGAGPNLAIAVVNAKDIAKPEDLADPSATCWIKMSEVSVEGLRQAFLDPVSRIRLASDPVWDEHTEFVAMAWQGGFLDGAAIHLNENLNVLIGGRGTGKSTVIESIRYVLGLNPIGEDAQKAHEGIIRHVLRGGTKISLLVRAHHPSKHEYVIERTIPNPPVVRDVDNGIRNLSPSDIVPRAEVYGQHEISELTKSPEKLTRLLDRFVERDSAMTRRKSDLQRELDRSRARILDVRKELRHVEERLAALPALEETLKQYQQAGLEERLKEQSLLVREERVLKTAADRVVPFREIHEQLARALPIDRAFLSPKALDGLPGKDILLDADSVLQRLDRELEAIAASLAAALDRAEQGLGEVRGRWDTRRQAAQQSYEKILRELQKSKIDGQEFIRLRQQIEELRPLKEREAVLRRTEKEHEDRRRQQITEWDDLKAEEFRQLERAAKKVSRQLAPRVRVQVTFGGNREPLARLLREQIGGRLSEAIDVLKAKPDLSLSELAAACRSGRDALAKKYTIPPAQAERMVQADPGVLMQIEELDLSPTTRIELNVSGEGQPENFQGLDELSTGQKATAVLLLLLLQADAPLIVDQAEDDLDNRFITEGIVPKMREEKRRRQFVFATHNANIPVLGDAELIVGLTAGGPGLGRAEIPPDHLGSIDSKSVRELVEELLEGGREAFKMRRRKYGF
jgi:DNA repair ATPase RecN